MIIKGTKVRVGLIAVLALISLGADQCQLGESPVKDSSGNYEKKHQCYGECNKLWCAPGGQCQSEGLNQCDRKCDARYPIN